MPFKVLSTKKLPKDLSEQFRAHHIELTAYDAICTKKKNIPHHANPANAIITSKAAYKSIKEQGIKLTDAFVVGEKTAAILKKDAINIIEQANSAKDLVQSIIKKHHTKHFTFYKGNISLPIILESLTKHQISFESYVCYETLFNVKEFKENFDALLFFSPSGVRSFTKQNKIGNANVYCIGQTTADEARIFTKNIYISDSPSIAQVSLDAIHHLKGIS